MKKNIPPNILLSLTSFFSGFLQLLQFALCPGFQVVTFYNVSTTLVFVFTLTMEELLSLRGLSIFKNP